MSCIDLLFWTNQNTISNYENDVSIFDQLNDMILLSY